MEHKIPDNKIPERKIFVEHTKPERAVLQVLLDEIDQRESKLEQDWLYRLYRRADRLRSRLKRLANRISRMIKSI